MSSSSSVPSVHQLTGQTVPRHPLITDNLCDCCSCVWSVCLSVAFNVRQLGHLILVTSDLSRLHSARMYCYSVQIFPTDCFVWVADGRGCYQQSQQACPPAGCGVLWWLMAINRRSDIIIISSSSSATSLSVPLLWAVISDQEYTVVWWLRGVCCCGSWTHWLPLGWYNTAAGQGAALNLAVMVILIGYQQPQPSVPSSLCLFLSVLSSSRVCNKSIWVSL